VRAAVQGDAKAQRLWAAGHYGLRPCFVILHGREWSKLISERSNPAGVSDDAGERNAGEFANVAKTVPQFAATFFGLTGMHMLHVTLGVVYLGRHRTAAQVHSHFNCPVARRVAANAGVQPVPLRAHVLLLAAIVCAIVLWLKPKVYDSSDVEVAGIVLHFVDLVWMFIFPLVYLMSAKIL